MKKLTTLLFILLCIFALNNNRVYSQDTCATLLEVCTGTWCQYCPCGHTIVEAILASVPNTLVLEYHGPTNYGDPFANFNGNSIMSLIGFSNYPTGVVGRQTGIVDRGAWFSWVLYQSSQAPTARITWVKTYNPATRIMNVTVYATALTNLTGNYYINYVMLEDNLIYNQTGNAGCPGASNYVHKHVVRDMINGATGEALNTGGVWNQNQTITKTFNYTINSAWVADNCQLGIFAYLQGSSLTSNSTVVQTKKQTATQNATGVNDPNLTVKTYSLEQNYPNPFNPVTNIKFSIPKDDNVTLKFYDILGNEVATYLNNTPLTAGTYNAEFDGSKLSSGIYFYKLTAGSFNETKKMILAK